MDDLSRGRLKIEVLATGDVVPALKLLDAVHDGNLDAGFATPLIWYGKARWTVLFGGMPFGPTPEQHAEWMFQGGGLDVQQDLYNRVLGKDVVVFLAGTGAENMAGWFRTPLRGPEDLRGLKIRAVGMSANVLRALGADVVILPISELRSAVDRGLLDAIAVTGPAGDLKLGLPSLLKIYHRPSAWLPTATALELIVARRVWDALPSELQRVVAESARRTHDWMLRDMRQRNATALEEITRRHGVQVVDLSPTVLAAVQRATEQTAREFAAQDPVFDAVWQAVRRAAGL